MALPFLGRDESRHTSAGIGPGTPTPEFAPGAGESAPTVPAGSILGGVATPARKTAENALRACRRVQRSQVLIATALRTGVATLVIVAGGIWLGRVPESVSVAMGLVFVSIADLPGAPRDRLRMMLWGLLWTTLGVLIGGLVGEIGALHVAVAIVLSLACGFAASLGIAGGLFGTLTLVLFACYAGTSVGTEFALLDALLFAGGGVLAFVLVALPFPLRQLDSERQAVARAYAEIAQATRESGVELSAPTIAAAVHSAQALIDRAGCSGPTREWLEGLTANAERIRLVLLGILGEEGESPDETRELLRRLAPAATAAAQILHRRHREAELRRAIDDLAGTPLDSAALTVMRDEGVSAFRSTADLLAQPWPVGRRAEFVLTKVPSPPVMARLRAHLHWGDPVAEHAVRLTVAFGVATAVAVAVGFPHAYWLPLTVAWVAKPDLGGTVTRVTMRILGTVVGVVICAACIAIIMQTPIPGALLALGTAASASLALAYLWANYPIAVVGITLFVLFSDYLSGEDQPETLVLRLVATVAAGLWVLLVTLVRPRRSGPQAVDAMRRACAALRDYAAAVRTGNGIVEARAAVLAARTAALGAVTAAEAEPRGIWERPGPRINAEDAAPLLSDIILATSEIVAEDLLREHDEDDPELWGRIDASLADLEQRVGALGSTR